MQVVPVPRGHDAAQHGDSEGGAQLAGQVVHRRADSLFRQPEDQQPKRRLSHALPQRTIPRVLNFRYCRDGRAFLFSQSIGMW
jgi:hypothetical protein